MQRRIINTSNKPTTSPINRSSVIVLPGLRVRANTPTTNSLSGPSRIIPHPIVISSSRSNIPTTTTTSSRIGCGRPGVFVKPHTSIISEEEFDDEEIEEEEEEKEKGRPEEEEPEEE